MCHPSADRRLDPMVRVGLLFLILANVVRTVVLRHAEVSESLADGMTGLCMGFAIGLMLLGLYRQQSARCRVPRG